MLRGCISAAANVSPTLQAQVNRKGGTGEQTFVQVQANWKHHNCLATVCHLHVHTSCVIPGKICHTHQHLLVGWRGCKCTSQKSSTFRNIGLLPTAFVNSVFSVQFFWIMFASWQSPNLSIKQSALGLL